MNPSAAPPPESMVPEIRSPIHAAVPCPICRAPAAPFDVIDFNRSCEPVDGKPLPLAGVAVYYHLCAGCGYCFAPAMFAWPPAWFSALVYNADYPRIDPDFLGARPDRNAEVVDHLFGPVRNRLRHLDYGGGSGQLSARLRERGWDTRTWDPFVQTGPVPTDRADLVTAFEVFEHVADLDRLARDMDRLTAPDGLVLFSTLTSDGDIVPGERLTWWYAAPRNGHIGLFSSGALRTFFDRIGFLCGSVSRGLHAAWRSAPHWLAESRFRVT